MRAGYKSGCFVYLLLGLLTAQLQAAPVVTAEFAPPPGLSGGFNIGAGMAVDPPAPTPFDNRLAQTFVAMVDGRPATASLIAGRSSSTDAPLWVDIVTMNNAQVANVLASGSVPASAFSDWIGVDAVDFNVAVSLTATEALVAGEEYAMVLRSATPDANYRVFGTHEFDYAEGEAWRSQNSLTFQKMSFGSDLFFQVTVDPVPEPRGVALVALALAAGVWVRRWS